MSVSTTMKAAAVFVALSACGCATYTSPFVHKTEEELEAMEAQDAVASAHFASGDYGRADAILKQLLAEPTVSSPLYEMERISVLLNQGKKDEAHELMMKVRADLDLLFDEKSEKEAISLWHGENKKVYKGDAHERSTLYAFLAMSFMERGDWDNAERCVKNGLLADSANTKEERFNSDYALLQYLGYVACARGGRAADADRYKEELNATLRACSPAAADVLGKSPLPNAFVVVWAGTPPSYVRGGAHKEIRHVIPGKKCAFDFLSAQPAGGDELLMAGGLADLNFQATTRGGREMDTVLADKAAAKTGMEASKNILILAGYGCFAAMGNDSKADLVLGCVGGGCFLLGITFHIVGECINADADIRSWKNLPGELIVLPISLPERDTEVEVRGYKGWDNIVCRKVAVPVRPDCVATAHVSMMQYQTMSNPAGQLLDAGVKLSKTVPEAPTKDSVAEIKPQEEGNAQ